MVKRVDGKKNQYGRGIRKMIPKQECIDELKELTSKKFVLLTQRGNASIQSALKLAKGKGFDKLLVQDQGGWITYKQYAEKLKFSIHELKTDCGLVDKGELRKYDKAVLLINSLPAYAYYENMETVSKICEQNKIFLINDSSGSIGSKETRYGDVVLGSFGKWKPVNAEEGGFIATDNEQDFHFLEKIGTISRPLDFNKILKHLKALPERRGFLDAVNKRLKKELKELEIIHNDKEGINVVVKYNDAAEKEKIINYCHANNLPYTECPRYIRVLEKAICIEVKRLEMR